MTDNPAPAVLKVSEVATLLRIGERQVRESVIRGEIPCHKIGGQIRCSTIAINRWLHGKEGDAYDLAVERQYPETSNGSGHTSPAAVMAKVR